MYASPSLATVMRGRERERKSWGEKGRGRERERKLLQS